MDLRTQGGWAMFPHEISTSGVPANMTWTERLVSPNLPTSVRPCSFPKSGRTKSLAVGCRSAWDSPFWKQNLLLTSEVTTRPNQLPLKTLLCIWNSVDYVWFLKMLHNKTAGSKVQEAQSVRSSPSQPQSQEGAVERNHNFFPALWRDVFWCPPKYFIFLPPAILLKSKSTFKAWHPMILILWTNNFETLNKLSPLLMLFLFCRLRSAVEPSFLYNLPVQPVHTAKPHYKMEVLLLIKWRLCVFRPLLCLFQGSKAQGMSWTLQFLLESAQLLLFSEKKG